MTGAILERARVLADRFGAASFSTAFVGGGTPTALGPEALRVLLAGISALSEREGYREWTVEANPESLDREVLYILRDSGVDRISLGFQSGEPEALKRAGRFAEPDAGLRALELAAGSWDGRLSVDLMVGLPGQTPEGIYADIARAAAAGAAHLSLYGLTIEEGTPLAVSVRKNPEILPSEELDRELSAAVREACGSAGLYRYEVSNWARPGSECLHNLNYWRSGSWIGVGPSAVSSFPMADGGTLRIEESRDHASYLAGAEGCAREERISPDLAAFETVMMAFRTREGLDSGAFRRRFGANPEGLLAGSLEKWRDFLEAGPLGPAPSDRLLDILNPFLLDCMDELERAAARGAPGSGGLP